MLVLMTLLLSEGSPSILLLFVYRQNSSLAYRQYYSIWCVDKITPFHVQTNYSLYQTDIHLLKCRVWLFLLDVSEPTILDMFCSWSEHGMNHHGLGTLLYRPLLVCLLCHWSVGWVGRHGLLNVVLLARDLKKDILLVELDSDRGGKRVLCCDGKQCLVWESRSRDWS
jgi:hypothetical protein